LVSAGELRPPQSPLIVDNRVVHFEGKADAIAAALRELIIVGELAPGASLRQRDLAARFGVSATPVREALSRLEAEGLVQHDLHRGATVIHATFDADQAGFEMRAALESLAAKLAARRITDEELEGVQELHEQFAARRTIDAEAVELNRRFHFEIYEASQSPVLLALLRLLWRSFRQSPQLWRAITVSTAQHAEIVEALRAHDAEAAERLTREHILGALEFFQSKDESKPNGGRARAKKPAAKRQKSTAR
jgi:DNA-binding GntR family transcriptional regulator